MVTNGIIGARFREGCEPSSHPCSRGRDVMASATLVANDWRAISKLQMQANQFLLTIEIECDGNGSTTCHFDKGGLRCARQRHSMETMDGVNDGVADVDPFNSANSCLRALWLKPPRLKAEKSTSCTTPHLHAKHMLQLLQHVAD